MSNGLERLSAKSDRAKNDYLLVHEIADMLVDGRLDGEELRIALKKIIYPIS